MIHGLNDWTQYNFLFGNDKPEGGNQRFPVSLKPNYILFIADDEIHLWFEVPGQKDEN